MEWLRHRTVVQNSQSESFEIARKWAMPSYEQNFVPGPLLGDQCELRSDVESVTASCSIFPFSLPGSRDNCVSVFFKRGFCRLKAVPSIIALFAN
ncbi:hypothetical protein AVEN_249834-1 [Araneus ventricosus]|uniref:Uncharacterized protein n=1 Tax=Araneus ventricosus TaxID=182803 RepID=A0A4Y2L236_ARAVE|nr:hypothetical protein AVEN_249834-1 [Araneus ventricosus]